MPIKRISAWPDGTRCAALFSDDERHRFVLSRILPTEQKAIDAKFPLFLMLNPSTATHEQSDPTVTRCAGFTKSWGYGFFHVANLFSLRSTDPRALYDAPDAEGDPDNLDEILKLANLADVIVCAWGVHGALRGRDETVIEALAIAGHGPKLRCLGQTKDGHPKHPLYLAADTPLVPFRAIARLEVACG